MFIIVNLPMSKFLLIHYHSQSVRGSITHVVPHYSDIHRSVFCRWLTTKATWFLKKKIYVNIHSIDTQISSNSNCVKEQSTSSIVLNYSILTALQYKITNLYLLLLGGQKTEKIHFRMAK